MYVDDVLAISVAGPTATIANDKNLSIGGKTVCDQVVVTCDYFVGAIDYIRLEKVAAVPKSSSCPCVLHSDVRGADLHVLSCGVDRC